MIKSVIQLLGVTSQHGQNGPHAVMESLKGQEPLTKMMNAES